MLLLLLAATKVTPTRCLYKGYKITGYTSLVKRDLTLEVPFAR